MPARGKVRGTRQRQKPRGNGKALTGNGRRKMGKGKDAHRKMQRKIGTKSRKREKKIGNQE